MAFPKQLINQSASSSCICYYGTMPLLVNDAKYMCSRFDITGTEENVNELLQARTEKQRRIHANVHEQTHYATWRHVRKERKHAMSGKRHVW